jgi:hypothetical protein
MTPDNDHQIYIIEGRHAGMNSDNLPKGIYI